MNISNPSQYLGTIFFGLAILHTFSVKFFQSLSHHYAEGSAVRKLFHLLGEVELVFGFWAVIFIFFFSLFAGLKASFNYLESCSFTEPIFVFVVLAVCSSRPILSAGERLIRLSGQSLPLNKATGFYIATLIIGPLLGSFITEPAAMTVTALILLNRFFLKGVSLEFRYATLGLLFVNISIGGTLTSFAAPPILMVAAKWNWNLLFVFRHFGWKALIAVSLSTLIVAYRFREEISGVKSEALNDNEVPQIPAWITAVHLLLLAAIVFASHSVWLFMALFLAFIFTVKVTKKYQEELEFRQALLVGLFLAGLVIMGGCQSWWLQPVLSRLSAFPLFFGSICLTAFTDNAALTYLGSQVANLPEDAKYALVAGSVVGGGLTVIANAPNPAGFGLLNSSFGASGISAARLFLNALLPTAVAAICFWFF